TSFQSPFLLSTINLPQIVDTRILLGSCTCSDKEGNCNRGQHPNDGHHNHDLHQSKTSQCSICGSYVPQFHWINSPEVAFVLPESCPKTPPNLGLRPWCSRPFPS